MTSRIQKNMNDSILKGKKMGRDKRRSALKIKKGNRI